MYLHYRVTISKYAYEVIYKLNKTVYIKMLSERKDKIYGKNEITATLKCI